VGQTIGVVAIDGPVAAGKTMAGREVAKRLKFRYLDTGVMYRAITWLALRDTVSTEDEEALGALARNNPILLHGHSSDRVLVGGVSVGPELRESEVDKHVSLVSRVSGVRLALVHQQRVLASDGKIVMVGRDIGTVVLPQADMKIFMTASLEERARRRWRELLSQGQNADYQSVMGGIKARDDVDTHRADSPLKPAEDAWLLNTDGRSGDEVVELILQRINHWSPSTN
jgi:cytidylate kinase